MEIKSRFGKHPTDDVLEDYSFNRLSEEDASVVEEHLLVCEVCQTALASVDDYISLMKAAMTDYAEAMRSQSGSRPDSVLNRLKSFWNRHWPHMPQSLHGNPAPGNSFKAGLRWNVVWALALLLTCMTALISWRIEPGSAAIDLTAYRGAPMAHAPSGRPLDLKLDTVGIAPAAEYKVEVVTSSGERVWIGSTPAHLPKGLRPGVYWVRLYSEAGELLREFGLRAG